MSRSREGNDHVSWRMTATLAVLSAGAGTLFSAGTAQAQIARIVNSSDWNIEYLYLADTGSWDWGPDQLGDGILYADGGWIDIPAPCAYYDLWLIDEDGDECVVNDLYLCNEAVGVTNAELLSCQGDTLAYGGVPGSPTATCGLGFELVFILPPLLWLRRCRRTLPVSSAEVL